MKEMNWKQSERETTKPRKSKRSRSSSSSSSDQIKGSEVYDIYQQKSVPAGKEEKKQAKSRKSISSKRSSKSQKKKDIISWFWCCRRPCGKKRTYDEFRDDLESLKKINRSTSVRERSKSKQNSGRHN